MKDYMNRETWLNDLAALMAPRFTEMGFPLPKFRVAIGFTSGGQNSKAVAECWHSSNSADRHFEILIKPTTDDVIDIANSLAHELTHAAVGFKHKHKGDFAKVALALGMLRPMSATPSGPKFIEWVEPFIAQLGTLPHAKLSWAITTFDKPRDMDAGDEAGEDESAENGCSNGKKKQSTRMLKATCQVIGAQDMETPCGYTVRLSKKWAVKLGACCPVHGAIEVEGADDAPADDDADAE